MSDFVARSTRRHRYKSVPGFEVHQVLPGTELAVIGELNVNTISVVRDALSAAIDSGEGELRVRLHGAEVIDAAGLGVLVGADRRAAKAGRHLVLTDVSPRLDRVIRSTKLSRVLTWTTPPVSATA